jgi:hypothetical protein
MEFPFSGSEDGRTMVGRKLNIVIANHAARILILPAVLTGLNMNSRGR